LLLAGYEGLKSRQDQIPPAWKGALREAADRLIELYKATGRDSEAAKWKELRAAYGPKD
jgi:hypothetical protein